MTQDDTKQLAWEIADILGEKLPGPRRLIREVVERCGADFCRETLKDTEEVMAAGGMLTNIGDRMRTKGGVFFYLARGRMSAEVRQVIFPPRNKAKPRKAAAQPTAEDLSVPELIWEERRALVMPLLNAPGEVNSVKITLIGRPGKIEVRRDVVVTTMSHRKSNQSFPRGIPPLPETPTLYTVYIAAKQWKSVEEALKDPEDLLILEGLCAFDPELQMMAVYTMKATTKLSETKKREAQQAAAPKANQPAKAEAPAAVEALKAAATTPKPAKAEVKASNPAAPPPRPATPASNLPPRAAQKLRELQEAAELYRQKIATIEAKPAGQQFGLEMTQKLLKTVEDQIEALQKQHS